MGSKRDKQVILSTQLVRPQKEKWWEKVCVCESKRVNKREENPELGRKYVRKKTGMVKNRRIQCRRHEDNEDSVCECLGVRGERKLYCVD